LPQVRARLGRSLPFVDARQCRQLTKLPPPSGKRFTRACVDSPREAETYRAQLQDGDVIVAYVRLPTS
jgi:hypothetical protein